MIGTLLNTATVVAGTVVGRLLGGRMPARIQETQMGAIGLVTLVMGVQNALTVFAPNHPPSEFLAALLALLVGGWIGEFARLDDRLQSLGLCAEKRFAPIRAGETDATAPVATPPTIARAFVTTTILFCVGPLTVLGCFDDGLRGDIGKLTIKSVLDGVSAAAFSAALGWGVLLTAAALFVFQGALTLGAGLLRPLLTDAMVASLTAAGGVMLVGLGMNLLGVTKIRIASLLPALVLAPFFLALLRALGVH